MDHIDIIGQIVGGTLIVLTIWSIVATLLKIQKNVGLVSSTGIPWMLVVIVGSLFGVILYRWFREPVEDRVKRIFRHGV